MGCSYQHDIFVKFDDELQAEMFTNYVNRNRERFNDTCAPTGRDVDAFFAQTPAEQSKYEPPNSAFDVAATAEITSNDVVVHMDSNGYGLINPVLLYTAFQMYGATCYHAEMSSCQGAEGMHWIYNYDSETDREEVIEIPDWANKW